MSSYAFVFIGLMGGNCLWQWWIGGTAGVAFERSWFQFVAVLCVYLAERVK